MAYALYPPSRPQSVGEVLDSAFRIYSATLLRCLPYSFASVILGQLLSVYDVLHRHGNTAAALQAVQIERGDVGHRDQTAGRVARETAGVGGLQIDQLLGGERADDVGFKDLLPVARPLIHERSYRAKYGGVRHQRI